MIKFVIHRSFFQNALVEYIGVLQTPVKHHVFLQDKNSTIFPCVYIFIVEWSIATLMVTSTRARQSSKWDFTSGEGALIIIYNLQCIDDFFNVYEHFAMLTLQINKMSIVYHVTSWQYYIVSFFSNVPARCPIMCGVCTSNGQGGERWIPAPAVTLTAGTCKIIMP